MLLSKFVLSWQWSTPKSPTAPSAKTLCAISQTLHENIKKETRELIVNHYSAINESSEIKQDFEKILVKFIEFHNFKKRGEYDTFFCNIHSNFNDGHNCVACNLNDSSKRIESFLIGYRLFTNVHSTMTNFIFLLYLQAECIFEYFNYLQLPNAYIQKKFQILFTGKRWANFLKHPKSFMLVHHPIWECIKDINIFTNKKNTFKWQWICKKVL